MRTFCKNARGQYFPEQPDIGAVICFEVIEEGLELSIQYITPIFFSQDGESYSETFLMKGMGAEKIPLCVELYELASGLKLKKRASETSDKQEFLIAPYR